MRVSGLRAACALALAAFGCAMVLAALAYPGGTWFDEGRAGFDFWQNYWCDLLAPIAHNGADNRLGRAWARAGFGSFGVALATFFVREARALVHGRAGVRAAGACAASVLIVVVSTSPRTQPLAHGAAVLGSALAGLSGLAAVLRAAALSPLERWLGRATFAAAALSLAAYVLQGAALVQAPWLAGAQKLTSLGLITFMVLRLAHKDE